MDIKEIYCSHYKETYEDLTGEYCICKGYCNSCNDKKWSEELDLPISKSILAKMNKVNTLKDKI